MSFHFVRIIFCIFIFFTNLIKTFLQDMNHYVNISGYQSIKISFEQTLCIHVVLQGLVVTLEGIYIHISTQYMYLLLNPYISLVSIPSL